MAYLDDLLTFKSEAPLPARKAKESEEVVRQERFLRREKRRLVEEPSDYRLYETMAGDFPLFCKHSIPGNW